MNTSLADQIWCQYFFKNSTSGLSNHISGNRSRYSLKNLFKNSSGDYLRNFVLFFPVPNEFLDLSANSSCVLSCTIFKISWRFQPGIFLHYFENSFFFRNYLRDSSTHFPKDSSSILCRNSPRYFSYIFSLFKNFRKNSRCISEGVNKSLNKLQYLHELLKKRTHAMMSEQTFESCRILWINFRNNFWQYYLTKLNIMQTRIMENIM